MIGHVRLGLSLAVIFLGLDVLGLFSGLERRSVDFRMASLPRPSRPMTDRIVHVDIDDSALARFGRWPWDRSLLADALTELDRAGAATIALDFLLSDEQQYPLGTEPTVDHDRLFADALGRSQAVVPVVLHAGPVFDAMWLHAPGPAELERLKRVLAADIQRDEHEVARVAGLTEPRRRAFIEAPLKLKRAAAWHALTAGAPNDEGPAWADFERRMTPGRGALSGDYAELPVLRWAWRQHRAWATLRPLLIRRHRSHGTHQDIATLPMFAAEASAAGFVSVETHNDADGTLRELPLVRTAPEGEVLQFGLAAAVHYLGLTPGDVRFGHGEAVIGDVRLPVRGGKLWIAWPTSNTRPRWTGLLNQSPTERGVAGHLSIREVIELARARRTQAALREQHATLTAVILDHANVERDGLPLDDPDLLQEVADEVAFTLEEAGPADDAAPVPGQTVAFRDHVHNCRLWHEVRRALDDAQTRIEAAVARLRGAVDGRLVFVGWTATGAVADICTTAIDASTPGVVVHAAVANMVMTGGHVRFVADIVSALLTLLPALLCAAIAGRFPALQSSLLSGVVLVVYAAAAAGLFALGDIAIPVAAPLITSVSVWAISTTVDAVRSQGDRRRITRQFRSRVSGQLVDHLIAHPGAVTVAGIEREITVLFGDLAGFTALSESLGGPRTVTMLNRYMGRLSEALIAHGAYVNKFLGDGVMAFWSAFEPDPAQARRAHAAIASCRAAMAELNAEAREEGLPALDLRVGVATGRVVVGDCGAPPHLHDYTVIGDAVNLAARLESANKQFGTTNVIDGRTRALLGDDVRNLRPLGRVSVVGQTAAVDVFEVMEPGGSDEQIDLCHAVVDAFTDGRLDEAETTLARLEAEFGTDPWTARFRRAIAEAVAAGDFEGTHRLQEK